jgi:hypothetical protein
MLYLSIILRHCKKVLESGTVGPEAITSRSSPTTSESMKEIIVAG